MQSLGGVIGWSIYPLLRKGRKEGVRWGGDRFE